MMRPRILIVGNFASSWGATEAVCEGLAVRLESRGWQVTTTSHLKPRIERLSDMLGTVLRRRDEYDVAVVEVFSGPAFVWAEAACHLLGVLAKPYVLSLRGGNLPDFAARHTRRMSSLFSRSAAVIAQSQYLVGIVPRHQHMVRLIPNPIDLSHCTYKMRHVLQPRLVWLRSFHHIYNPSLAVRVVGLLKPEYPDLSLTMIGPDKGDGSLEAARGLTTRLGLEKNIHFQPGIPKEDVPSWLDRADIFLNTTNVDNTPVSVQEAMACGLCVVSTRVGGVPYLVTDRVDALLVPPDDPHAMVEAVRLILADPETAAGLSRAARSKVERMDWPLVTDRWERLISSVAYQAGHVSSRST